MQAHIEGSINIGSDLKLFVRQFGKATKNLLFIHGGPDWDHSYLIPYVLPLANDFRLTLFDMRGCGLSTKFGNANHYSLAQAANDVADLIRVLELKSLSILGFSFGGRVLMEYLANHTSDVRSVILASTTAYTDFQGDLNGWDEYNIRNNEGLKGEVASLFSGDLTDQEKTRQLAFLTMPLDIWDLSKMDIYRSALETIRFSGEWMNAWQAGMLKPVNTNYENIFRDLNLPTLILHGEKDMRFPISVAERLHSALPQSNLGRLKGTGHMGQIEMTEKWVQTIRSFLLHEHTVQRVNKKP